MNTATATATEQQAIPPTRAWLKLPPGRLSAGLFAAIAAFAVAGGAQILRGAHGGVLDLDGDWTLPAAFSALLLACAALCAFAVGRRQIFGMRRSAYLLGALFLVMGLDEAFQLHERLESATGVDWQLLYLPLILVCGVAWLLVTRALGRFRPAQALMVVGGVAWLAAQTLEQVQWNGDVQVAGYSAMMFAEEILEMGGSALFLIALYWVLFRRDSRSATVHEGDERARAR